MGDPWLAVCVRARLTVPGDLKQGQLPIATALAAPWLSAKGKRQLLHLCLYSVLSVVTSREDRLNVKVDGVCL